MDFLEIELKERNDNWAMSELQSHDYYELYFLMSGSRSFFFENKMYNVSERAFCIIPPFHMHKTTGGSYKRVNINISPDLLSPHEREFLDNSAKSIAFTLDQERASLIFPLLSEASAISRIEAKEKKSLSLSFVHTILYLLEKKPLPTLDRNAQTSETTYDTLILQVAAYIGEHYNEPLNLSKLSERFYISVNTLCLRFRAAMHCSVIQYLAFVRISKAKELLTTTEKSMEEISELCGYSSANYFSLTFKKAVGLSPRKYKRTK